TLSSLLYPLPPSSTLFPYTTLFRSNRPAQHDPAARSDRGAFAPVPPSLRRDAVRGSGAERGSCAPRRARYGRRTTHAAGGVHDRSEEHTSELQSLAYLVCRLLLVKK